MSVRMIKYFVYVSYGYYQGLELFRPICNINHGNSYKNILQNICDHDFFKQDYQNVEN